MYMFAKTLIPAILAIALLPLPLQAAVYSWKDAEGKIHYGDRPPLEHKESSHKLPPPPPDTADVEAARKAGAERKMEQGLKQTDNPAEAVEDPAAKAQRMKNCQISRNNLAGLQDGSIRFRKEKDGGRAGLDGKVREDELKKVRKDIEKYCSPPKAQ